MITSNIPSATPHRAIVGLGVTGQSVARHLKKTGEQFSVFDSRTAPPGLDDFRSQYPETDIHLGEFSEAGFAGLDELILSPGIDANEAVFKNLREGGVRIIGDIDMFAENAHAPIVAITGSNAKSTVTTLVGEMAKADGINVSVGGNLGVPALDLLDESVELYVLELSSFQLETTNKLNAEVACILNLSQDHLDRHADMEAYQRAKQRIYLGAKHAVCNGADERTAPVPVADRTESISTFNVDLTVDSSIDLDKLSDASGAQFGVLMHAEQLWICADNAPLLPTSKLSIRGRHNVENAVAAVAIGSAAKISHDAMIVALQKFTGLPHRCETVGVVNGVHWINDSKATNTGAVIAALEGFAEKRNIVLIAGGQAKGQQFDELANAIAKHVKLLVLIGEAAQQLADVIETASDSDLRLEFAGSMEAAVKTAFAAAGVGDVVLMSPACASFDMFQNYEARGEAFADAVRSLQ